MLIYLEADKEGNKMKRSYVAPTLEMELYELDQAIASNCGIVVKPGPAMGIHEECEGYVDPWEGLRLMSAPSYNVDFYEDTNCDCYTSGGDYGSWQS